MTSEGASRSTLWRDLPFLGVIAIALALLIKAFLVQAFFIPSASMEKTLHGCPGCQGDRVLVNKVLYDVRGIHRGEIVVFNGKNTDFPPETSNDGPSNAFIGAARGVQRFLGLGAPGESDFIKRVIGLPGDKVQCCTDGKVVVNGKVLDESYIYQDDHMAFCAPVGPDADVNAPATAQQCAQDAKPFIVPPHRLFVLGDHRSLSADSRYHGTIPKRAVVGRAFVKVWPIKRIGLLEVPHTFTTAAALGTSPLPLGIAGALPITAIRRRNRRRRISAVRVKP